MPYRLAVGTKFYERREIRDVIAYLKLLYNPADSVSLMRVINVPARGIGRQTLMELSNFAAARNTQETDGLRLLLEVEESELANFFSQRSIKILQSFSAFINEMQEMSGNTRTLELFDKLVARTQFKKYLESQPDGEDRWQNVLELRSVAQQYNDMDPEEGLAAFLESVALVADTDSLGEVADSVNLITLHQAKGLEFPVVFIVGLEEGVLPHYRSQDDPAQMEEERRLCYVGITRAKDRVYLSRAYRRMLMGSTQNNPPSRFIGDIPEELFLQKKKLETNRFTPKSTKGFSNKTGTKNDFTLPAKKARALEPEAKPQEELPQLKAGNRVRHAQFGEGVVISTKPSGTDQEVVVAFDDNKVHLKRLLLSFARLEKVSRD